MNSRAQYGGRIDNLFGVISVDNMPHAFGEALAPALQNKLAAVGVRSTVRTISDLDIQPVSNSDLEFYRYLMVCKPSQIYAYNNVINSVTLNCSVTDVRARAVVLKADVRTIRAIGWMDFGGREAERASAELVSRMASANLLSPALQSLNTAPPAPPSPRYIANATPQVRAEPLPLRPISRPAPPRSVEAAAPQMKTELPIPRPIPAPPPPPQYAEEQPDPFNPHQVPERPLGLVSDPPPTTAPAEQGRVIEIEVLPDGAVRQVRDAPH